MISSTPKILTFSNFSCLFFKCEKFLAMSEQALVHVHPARHVKANTALFMSQGQQIDIHVT